MFPITSHALRSRIILHIRNIFIAILFFFCCGTQTVFATQYWWRFSAPDNVWSNPNNWSTGGFFGGAAGAAPGAADIATFGLLGETPNNITFAPATITVGAIYAQTLQRTLTFPAGAILNIVGTGSDAGGNANINIAPGATMRILPGATIQGAGGAFRWSIDGTLELVDNGAVISSGLGFYPGSTLLYSGTVPKTSGFEFIDGNTNMPYAGNFPGTVNITNTGGVTFASGVTQNFASLTISTGTRLTVDAGTTLNNGGTVTVQNGGFLRFNNTGAYTGTAPSYAIGSTLEYTGTVLKTVGSELPGGTPINANVILSNTGGITLGAGLTYQLNAGMTMNAGSILTLNNNTILDLIGGNYCWGGVIQGNASASLRILNPITHACGCVNFIAPQQLNQLVINASGISIGTSLTVLSTLTVSAGQLNIGSCGGTPVLSLQGGGNISVANGVQVYGTATLDINGATPLSGVGSVQYNAGATLQYSGAGNLTAGLEFPVAGPTNLIINKPSSNNVTLPGNRSLPLAPTPGVLTLTSGILHTAGFQMQILNTALGAVTGYSSNSYVSLGAGGIFQRAIQAGGATWDFPVGDLTAYRPLALIAPSGGSTVSVQHGNAAGGTANIAPATMLNPLQNPFWVINPSALFSARVQAGFAGVSAAQKLGVTSPTDAGAVYAGVGGATPDVFTALTPPILTSVNTTTFNAGVNSYIRVGDAYPTTYYHNGITDPAVSTSWTSIPGGLGIPAPGFYAGYTFIIQSGVTATYISSFAVPSNVTIQINNGGTLRINGNFNLTSGGAGAALNYMGTTAVLEYFGGSGVHTTNSFEFPDAMTGALVVNRNIGTDLHLNAAKTIAGTATFTFGRVWNNGFSPIIFNGAVTVNGANATYWSSGAGATIFNAPSTVSAGRIQLSGGVNPLRTNALLTVSGTGVLELQGTAQIDPLSTNNVNFAAGGTLQFTSGWSGTPNLQTLPTTMVGNVDIQGGTVMLGAPRTLQGNLNIAAGQTLDVNGQTLTLAGSGTITSPNRIAASPTPGSTIAVQRNNIDASWFTSNGSMNLRIDQNTVLTNNYTVGNQLNLNGGILSSSVGNLPIIVNSSNTAVVGATPTSFVNGPMQWYLPVGYSGGATWSFPVGKGGVYLPFQLNAPNTPAGSNVLLEVEATNSDPMGTPAGGLGPISNTEYWRMLAVGGSNTLTSAQYTLGRPTAIPMGSQVTTSISGSNGAYNPLIPAGSTINPGPPNSISSTGITGLGVGSTRHFAISGIPPTTFYYFGGNADVFSNWNSNVSGGGSTPANFNSGTFVVNSNRNAAFTVNTTFGPTAILNVANTGTVTVSNGVTLTNNGQFWVSGGGRLTLQGNGALAGSAASYFASTAVLEYSTPANRITTPLEFPNTMQAQVEIHSGSIKLDTDKWLQSSFLVNNSSVDFFNGNRLRLSGGLTFLGMTTSFLTDATDTLIVDSTGTIAGSVDVQQLARFVMNRPSTTFNLSGTMRVAEQLHLLNGNISLRTGENVILQNAADTSLVGGGASSYIVGSLVRRLRPNLSAMTASSVAYPIGTTTRFLPAYLVNSTTGSMGADVGIESFGTGAGGSVAPGATGALSTSEHWRSVVVGGQFLGGNIHLVRSSPILNAQHQVGTSTLKTGSYNSVGGTLMGTSFGPGIVSASVQHSYTPFANVGNERFYSVLGILPNAPRIFGFSPSSGGNGTVIRVTGANFSTITAISIGGIPVTQFTLLGDSTFTAMIGNGVSGAVQVTGSAGGAASDSIFRFIPPPSIGTISPNPAGLGTQVVINGTNLTQATSINIGGVNIPVTPDIFTPEGNIRLTIPPSASNATISISTPGGFIESKSALTLVPRPVVLSISPNIASTGEVITVTGQNFTNIRFVRFGGHPGSPYFPAQASATVNSPTRMSIVVPPRILRPTTATLAVATLSEKNSAALNSENSTPITIDAGGGTVTTGSVAATQFFYRAVLPGSGGAGGGGSETLPLLRVDEIRDRTVASGGIVRVTGANMDVVVGIQLSTSLGTTTASWRLSSTAQLDIITPTTGLLAGTTQSVSSIPVTAWFIGAYNQVTVQNAFTIVAVPRVFTIQPPSAAPNETITVTGENLNLVTQATIGGIPVPFQITPDGRIAITVPVTQSTNGSMNPPSGTLVLRGTGGSTIESQTIINAEYLSGLPIITSFSPTSGSAGTVIVVTGANLSSINDVLVGGITAQFIVNSPNRITIILGNDISAETLGRIALVTASGTVESRQNFTFTQSLESEISRLATGLGISVEILRTRIEQERNRITGLNLASVRLSTPNFAFPDVLRNLTSLKKLNLSNCGLVGPIPAWIGELKDLEEIDVSRNELTGDLRTEFVCIYPNLRLLNVSSNRLQGSIPLCITTREKVQTLRLDNNQFTGTVPAELGTMPNLKTLTLNNNMLTGVIPPAFGRIAAGKTAARTQDAKTLETLDLSNNQLSGSIPAELGAMSALKTLNLAKNRFTGGIPSELGNISTLENLNLSENQFTGEIPPQIGLLKKLKVVRLQGNIFTDVPTFSDVRIDTLEMQNNHLQFNSLESNIGLQTIPQVRYVYSPQDSIGAVSTREIRIGDGVEVRVDAAGTSNVYEWRKNGILVQNANAAVLRIPAVSSADAGMYVCRITNRRVPNLEIFSRPQFITVTTTSLTNAAPELIYPSNFAEGIGVKTRLEWKRVAGVDGYEVQWSEDISLRAGVERRFVPQNPTDTSSSLATQVPSLSRGKQVYWRVRAIAGSDLTNIAVSSQWSDVRSFTVVPLGVDIALATIDAGKANIGEVAFGQSIAANVSSDAITLDNISIDAADTSRFRIKTGLPAGGQAFQLQAGAELPIELAFTPKQTGSVTGTVHVRYRDGQGTARNVSFRAIARGVGSALSIAAINFDTMRVTKRTLRTGELINRNPEAIRILSSRIVSVRGETRFDNSFTVIDSIRGTDFRLFSAGDTLPLIVSANPTSIGTKRELLRVITASSTGTITVDSRGGFVIRDGWLDTTFAEVRGIARMPSASDAYLRLGLRASEQSVAPGGMVTMEVYIAEGNKQAAFIAGLPEFRGTVRYNKQVLTLGRGNTNGARILRESSNASDMQRVVIPKSTWDGRTDVLFTFPALAVAGNTDVTMLEVENIVWGIPVEKRGIGESQVFIEEPVVNSFTAKACEAGGKRLVTSAKQNALAAMHPNPVKDIANVEFTLREDGTMALDVVNASGKVVQSVLAGEFSAGDYIETLDCSHLPSGTYLLRLRTINTVVTTRFSIVR